VVAISLTCLFYIDQMAAFKLILHSTYQFFVSAGPFLVLESTLRFD
jgi:hypothetical protein